MDSKRFDALARRLGDRTDRRTAVRRLGAGALAVAAAAAARPAPQPAAAACGRTGCACTTGTRFACDVGFECCATSSGAPGSSGACAPVGSCGAVTTCVGSPGSCGTSCAWGAACDVCCSGYCGDYGVCESQACTGPGCSCPTGAQQPCDWNLVCCPLYSGDLMGGAGVCRYSC